MADSLSKIIEDKQANFKVAWKNVWTVFARDVKRIFTMPLLIFVFIGALFLPCLYSWLTIMANWDPYSQTQNIKIGVVNQDIGVDSTIGGHLALGDMLQDQLSSNSQLGWTFTDEDSAMKCLESGEYYAVIVLPQDFSGQVATIFSDANKRDFVHLDYYVNERENGAAVKVTDTGASTIEYQINQKFIAKVTEVVSSKTVELASAVNVGVANTSTTLSDRVSRVANNLWGFSSVLDQGKGTISQAEDTILQAKNTIVSVKSESDQLYTSVENCKQTCDNVRSHMSEMIDELWKKYGYDVEAFIAILSTFESTLSDVSATLAESSSALYKLSFTCEAIIYDLDETYKMLNDATFAGAEFQKQILKAHDMLFELSTFISANLTNTPQLIKDFMNADAKSIGAFMSQPVNLETQTLNKIENNGTGISPFFTNLAIWVLGIVLIALFRTEVEPPKRKGWNAKQAYVARGLLFSLGALISGVMVSLGNLLIGIQCENPILYVASCVLIAFVYVNIIYMLAACFKHVGRAIACILVIMQIPGSSGMFPIQLMPEGFQNIFPFLPFTYGINALRECIINIDYLYWSIDLIALVIFFAISFFIGLYAREGLRGINKLFDDELAKNTIMICDSQDHLSLQTGTVEAVVENLSDNTEAINVANVIDFAREKYKKKSRVGLFMLAVFPLTVLVVISIFCGFVEVDINFKLVWMTIWMLLVILFATYVIFMEYKYKQFKAEENASLEKAEELSEAKSNA